MAFHQTQPSYPQSQMQSQIQPNQKAMGVPSTPNPQHVSQTVFNGQRQMTPVANQGFKIPIQSQPAIRSANNINFAPNDNIHVVQRGHTQNQPFFGQQIQAPQTVRNPQPAQIKIMNPPSPSNFQVVNPIKVDRIVHSP